jgi:hypothetical protein
MQKKTAIFLILLLLGAGYFVLFWFPNSTGARDLNMTYIFQSDEPAQYTHMIRMLMPGQTLSQTAYRFFAYQIYFYGFPYYFYTWLVVLLPLKLLTGGGNVALNMLFLRQLVSVLPMITAVTVFVYLQTKFESYLQSILLFILLLSVPEVVQNDMWLHPESLVLLLIVLTFFFLDRDRLQFGKNFYLAAVFCGIAIATKLIGLFFFLTIPLYIFLGFHQKRMNIKESLRLAAFFVGILAVTFVLSNPFLFWESERAFAIKTQTNLHAAMSTGFIVAYHNSPLAWFGVITENYCVAAFLILSVIAVILGMLKGNNRMLNMLIAAWALPFMIYISVALIIRPTHFPLPILLPVFSALPAYFIFFTPAQFTLPWADYLRKNGLRLFLLLIGVLIVGWQFVYSLGLDITQYQSTLTRENNNPSLKFYSKIDQDFLSHIVLDRPLVVFRDVIMYVPNSSNYEVFFQFGTSNFAYVQHINADLLLLSKQHLHDYTQPGQLQGALNPNFAQTYKFYNDALAGNVAGYTLLYQDEFGISYLSTPLYNQFISTH